MAYGRAEQLGCESMQIFTRNQRQWLTKPLSFQETEDFYLASKGSCVKVVVSHASYLINLAGSDDIRARSETALISEVGRCGQLEIPYVVLHPGFAGECGKEEALDKLAASLTRVLNVTENSEVTILLETMAGQGSVLGGDVSEFSEVLDRMNDNPRVCFCVDMCHIFAAGYEIRSAASYNRFIDLLDKYVGVSRVKCWHLSDCKKERGSKLDRHAHLGQGEIGLCPFGMLMGDERFANVPAILETPKDGEGDAGNLQILRKLRGA